MNTCFFLGKGGVGKTTLALAWGLARAREGRRTLVLSLDPAHNLADYTGHALADEPREVQPGLWLQEVDIGRRSQAVLDRVLRLMRSSYRHLEVLNLEHTLETLRYSPGAEESAYLEVLQEVRQGPWDAVAVDLPPTGLALKLVHQPFASLLWVQRLLALRQQVRRLEATVARLHGRPAPQDPVFRELLRLFEEYEGLIRWFRSEAVAWYLVETPEPAAREEARRIREALHRLKIHRLQRVCNRCEGAEPGSVPEMPGPLRFPQDFGALGRRLPPAPGESPETP